MHPPKFINEILFGQTNFLDNKDNFLLLKQYMLLDAADFYTNAADSNANADTLKPIVKPAVYSPPRKDSLFWCIHMAIYGDKEGTKINHINVAMNEKHKMSDHFNANPELLKQSNHRITLAKINEIKCNLMTKPTMDSIESCVPCAIFYGRPIIIYMEDIHMHVKFVGKNYISDDDNDETIYLRLTNNKIVLEYAKPENLGIQLYHYEKPLQGASNYTVEELKIIYKQVFNEEPVDMKKPEMYEAIMVKCSSVLQTRLF